MVLMIRIGEVVRIKFMSSEIFSTIPKQAIHLLTSQIRIACKSGFGAIRWQLHHLISFGVSNAFGRTRISKKSGF
jgi:hypothetical protein